MVLSSRSLGVGLILGMCTFPHRVFNIWNSLPSQAPSVATFKVFFPGLTVIYCVLFCIFVFVFFCIWALVSALVSVTVLAWCWILQIVSGSLWAMGF